MQLTWEDDGSKSPRVEWVWGQGGGGVDGSWNGE